MLEVRHLTKSFELATPLKDVNCVVNKGDVIAVIGPSGCGKSTFINCLNRLIEPSGGQVFFDGEEITAKSNLSKLRMKMGMVFQSFNLFSHLTVLENVMYGQIELLKKSKIESYNRAVELLDSVGLASKADRYPFELSGGQQQRVAICRALAMDPEILLMDEPTSALDPTMVGDVELVIKKLADQGYTMIIVTHEMKFARNVANRIFFMDEGVIYEEGTPDEIFNHPKKVKTQWFIQRLKVFSVQIDPTDFDSYSLKSKLFNFAKSQMMTPKTLTKVELVFDDVIFTNILPYVKGTLIDVNIAYNDQQDIAEISISHKGEPVIKSYDYIDDISKDIILYALPENDFDIVYQDDTTSIKLVVGGN